VIPAPRVQEILLPVAATFIFATVAGALLLNLVPWPGTAGRLRPDFCALVLLYWGVHQPRRIGFTVAFALGLAMDIADASLFGQHALAYTALMYAGIVLHRRVLNFSLAAQVLHVWPLLAGADAIALVVRLAAGGELPAAEYLAGSLIGALLWAPMSVLFRLQRLPRPDPDRV